MFSISTDIDHCDVSQIFWVNIGTGHTMYWASAAMHFYGPMWTFNEFIESYYMVQCVLPTVYPLLFTITNDNSSAAMYFKFRGISHNCLLGIGSGHQQ